MSYGPGETSLSIINGKHRQSMFRIGRKLIWRNKCTAVLLKRSPSLSLYVMGLVFNAMHLWVGLATHLAYTCIEEQEGI